MPEHPVSHATNQDAFELKTHLSGCAQVLSQSFLRLEDMNPRALAEWEEISKSAEDVLPFAPAISELAVFLKRILEDQPSGARLDHNIAHNLRFGGLGEKPIHPYQTCYQPKAKSLYGTLAEFGWIVNPELGERPDHISVILALYAEILRMSALADRVVSNRLLKNSRLSRHGWRGELQGLCKSLKFGENRKPRFLVFEGKKSTDGLFQHPAKEEMQRFRRARETTFQEHLAGWTPDFCLEILRETDIPAFTMAAGVLDRFILFEARLLGIETQPISSGGLSEDQIKEDPAHLLPCARCGTAAIPRGVLEKLTEYAKDDESRGGELLRSLSFCNACKRANLRVPAKSPDGGNDAN